MVKLKKILIYIALVAVFSNMIRADIIDEIIEKNTGDGVPKCAGQYAEGLKGCTYLIDKGCGVVKKYDKNREYIMDFPGVIQKPEGIAIDGQNRIYVSDNSNNRTSDSSYSRIYVFTEDGVNFNVIDGYVESTAQYRFNNPKTLRVVGDKITIGDQNNKRISVINDLGNVIGTAPIDITTPVAFFKYRGQKYDFNSVPMVSAKYNPCIVFDEYNDFGIIRLYIDIDQSGSWKEYQSQGYFPLSLADGTHNISFYTKNYLGSVSAVESFSVTFDNTIAPAVITTLTADTGYSITLNWIATGSDGNSGTASGYILKYSSFSITDEALFNSADTYAQNWTPLSAGSKETKELDGLEEGMIWYFAIKAYDAGDNESNISNSTSAIVIENYRFVSVSGSDSNDGLTEDAAFATIQKAMDSAVPGTKIIITEGTYSNQTVIISTSGTVEKPIIIQGRGEAILDGADTQENAFFGEVISNIEISNLTIQHYTLTGITLMAPDTLGGIVNYNITISSCNFIVSRAFAIRLYGGLNVTIFGNRFDLTSNSAQTAITCGNFLDEIYIENNTFIGGGAPSNLTQGFSFWDMREGNVYIRDNRIVNVTSGMYLYSRSAKCFIENNVLQISEHSVYESYGLHIALGDQAELTVKNNNIIFSSESRTTTKRTKGIHLRVEGVKTLIEDNTIANFDNGILCDYLMNEVTIINNSVVNSKLGGIVVSADENTLVSNNIVSNYDVSSGTGIFLSQGLVSYNLVNNYQIPVSTVLAIAENNIFADPIFVDERLGDYRLMSNSPCIDAGDPSPEYNDPDNSICDIGAYYYGYNPEPDPGYNTRAGENVIVELPPDVKVNYLYVYEQGNTQAVGVTISDIAGCIIVPANAGYEITTDVNFEGLVTVALKYPDNLEPIIEDNLELLYLEDFGWVNTTFTRDTANNIIYGKAHSLGLFCVAYRGIVPPRTTLSVGEPKYIDEINAHVTSATTFTLTAVDDFIEIGDGAGFGIKEIKYKIDDEPWQVYMGTFSVSGEGSHVISYYSVDNVGNTEIQKTASIIVDNSPPEVSNFVVEPLYFSPNGDGIRDAVNITAELSEYADWIVKIKDSDKTVIETIPGSGEVPSGVSALWSPSGLAEGDYSISIAVTDRLGNYAGEFQENFNTLSEALWTQGHSGGLSAYSSVAYGWLNLNAEASASGQYGTVYAVSKEVKSLTDEIEFNVRMRVPTEQNGSNGNFFWNEFYLLPADISGTEIQPHDCSDWLRFVARVDPDNTNPEDPDHFGVHWMVQRRVSGGGVGTIYTSYDDRNVSFRDFPYNMKEAEWHILINDEGNIYVDLTDINGIPIRVENGAYQRHFNTAYIYTSQRTNVTSNNTCTYDYVKISGGLEGKVTADLTPPAALTGLSAETGDIEGKINLSWISPGDDGTNGILTGMFRIDYSSFTKAWDKDDYKIEISIAGCEPGSLYTKTLTGLTGGVTYYFAFWTNDRVQIWSEVSNIAQAMAQYDVTAPAVVLDLAAVTGDKPYSITLNWTAPGDDGSSGTAASYTVKYATFTIDESNWGSASDYSNSWFPQISGSMETKVLTGLDAKRWYFAIKAFDNFGNESGISNSTSAIAGVTLFVSLSGS
ncbi:MAG: hypothetical protein FP827_05910, partial [Candidatus Omnitrophica bacterium]|nr:hypothetical protein [Candidatus Omnitrophota bacterium]